jgi:dTMP kinase
MFLVFEGIDGSGMSTQARRLREHLERVSPRRVLLVREPGGTELGERIRDLLLDPSSGDLSPQVELFLFMAARAQLSERVIQPALRRGEIVISDRFLWSSVAYQGIAGGLGAGAVMEMGRMATAGLAPAMTFLIDLDPEVASQRLGELDRVERRGVEFQRRVRDGFLELAREHPGEFRVIDGGASIDDVHACVVRELAGLR